MTTTADPTAHATAPAAAAGPGDEAPPTPAPYPGTPAAGPATAPAGIDPEYVRRLEEQLAATRQQTGVPAALAAPANPPTMSAPRPTPAPAPGPEKKKLGVPAGPIRISAVPTEESQERELLFVLEEPRYAADGELLRDEDGNVLTTDREVTIPRKIPAAVAFRMMGDMYRSGDYAAIYGTLLGLLGEEAMQALESAVGMDSENFRRVMRIIEVKVGAAAKHLLGNS
ncbi:hypothetical protein [Streptomyces sp. ST2-7A]|uniref:hypothetical protein n=1 Tax=Streptomyces sp. ST2-7A TaxID=2907214 RepID=UPI001F46F1A1|nr:hypothetical protein [Streptomyces sp. ST2-7A]MCE7081163.1 hypothetical protein [Streptomyces sp. ST2-7A]